MSSVRQRKSERALSDFGQIRVQVHSKLFRSRSRSTCIWPFHGAEYKHKIYNKKGIIPCSSSKKVDLEIHKLIQENNMLTGGNHFENSKLALPFYPTVRPKRDNINERETKTI